MENKELYVEVLVKAMKDVNTDFLDGFCYSLDCLGVLTIDSMIRNAIRNLDDRRYCKLLEVTNKHFKRTLHK